MVKLKVFKKIGKSVIDIGIQEVEDINFARQLIEKGLATLVEGEIPERETREKIEVKEVVKDVVKKVSKNIKKKR